MVVPRSNTRAVTGDRLADVRPGLIPAVLAAYPRLDVNREFTARLMDQASRKPTSPGAFLTNAGIFGQIAQAPFDSWRLDIGRATS